MTPKEIADIETKTLLIPGKEPAFREAMAAGRWEDAIGCARDHRTDDLVYGAMQSEDIPGGAGYTPRWELFGNLTPSLNDEDYFRLLGKVLVETEKYAPPVEVEHYFAPKGRDASKRRFVMNPDEQRAYDSLPTRSEAVARHFAEHPAQVVDS